MDARSASQRFRRRHRRKHDDAKSSNAGMRAQIARGLPLAKWTSGPTQFKIKTLLSRVATYPSGALRRAGASSGRAIAIAVRDARRGRRGANYDEDRDVSLKSRALDGGRLSYGILEFSQVSALVCIFTEPEHARARFTPRKIDEQ